MPQSIEDKVKDEIKNLRKELQNNQIRLELLLKLNASLKHQKFDIKDHPELKTIY